MPYPLLALAGTLAAGAFTGTALMPLKYIRAWKFENTWLLYSVLAYFLSPWLVAALTVPHLNQVYLGAGARTCTLVAAFGFGWGLAVVLNGIGVAMVGLSLASTILMGSSIALGSLLALAFADVHRLVTRSGAAIIGLDLVMLAGVLLCAKAGKLRASDESSAVVSQSTTARGILICLVAGLMSTLLNVALSYGQIISREAIALGASSASAANAIWSLAVSAGSLPSLIWCLSRVSRTKAWGAFTLHFGRNATLCGLMALMFITGTVIYGAAAGMLGQLGAAIGWPIYMSGIILISNCWGWAMGEWRGAPTRAINYMLTGILVQIAAILALGRIH